MTSAATKAYLLIITTWSLENGRTGQIGLWAGFTGPQVSQKAERALISFLVRTLKIVLVLLLAAGGVAGCGLFGDDAGPSEDERIQQILDESASFSVILDAEATTAQREGVEAALRALPGFTGLTFTDHDAAYQRMLQMYAEASAEPPEVEPEILPETFEVSMTNIAAVQKVRDTQSTVQNLPGVQEVVFACTTVPECRAKFSRRPSAPPS